jgi:hypothetical protein
VVTAQSLTDLFDTLEKSGALNMAIDNHLAWWRKSQALYLNKAPESVHVVPGPGIVIASITKLCDFALQLSLDCDFG